jgi:hypothetical protein
MLVLARGWYSNAGDKPWQMAAVSGTPQIRIRALDH